MASWKIGSRGGACARCERTFEDGQRHVSTLVFNAEAELWREDLCPDCWTPADEAAPGAQPLPGTEADGEAGQAPVEDPAAGESTAGEPVDGEPVAASAPPLFWWFTRHRAEKKKTLQLDLAALEQIFVSLEGREEEPVRELRYLLCLILMRKRRVKLEKLERSPEGESFIVKRPRRDQRFRVFVYDFSPERLDELRAQLQALFDGADLEDGLNLPGGQGQEPAEAMQADGASEESAEESAEGGSGAATDEGDVDGAPADSADSPSGEPNSETLPTA